MVLYGIHAHGILLKFAMVVIRINGAPNVQFPFQAHLKICCVRIKKKSCRLHYIGKTNGFEDVQKQTKIYELIIYVGLNVETVQLISPRFLA